MQRRSGAKVLKKSSFPLSKMNRMRRTMSWMRRRKKGLNAKHLSVRIGEKRMKYSSCSLIPTHCTPLIHCVQFRFEVFGERNRERERESLREKLVVREREKDRTEFLWEKIFVATLSQFHFHFSFSPNPFLFCSFINATHSFLDF